MIELALSSALAMDKALSTSKVLDAIMNHPELAGLPSWELDKFYRALATYNDRSTRRGVREEQRKYFRQLLDKLKSADKPEMTPEMVLALASDQFHFERV